MKTKIFSIILMFIVLFSWLFVIKNNNIVKAWLESPSYMIETDNMWLWWKQLKEWNAKETVDNTLSVIITKLMVAFWVLALLIMTVWGWYMISAHWQDEMLSKWKSIFNAWIIALIIALASGIIMKSVIYILY